MSSEIARDAGTAGLLGFPAFPPQNAQFAFDQQFGQLADTWKNETGHLSNVTKKCMHPAYQRIIGLGAAAVPLVLRDLKATHDDWFWALSAITGDNPISERDAGDVTLMAEAWLQWGKTHGYDV